VAAWHVIVQACNNMALGVAARGAPSANAPLRSADALTREQGGGNDGVALVSC